MEKSSFKQASYRIYFNYDLCVNYPKFGKYHHAGVPY